MIYSRLKICLRKNNVTSVKYIFNDRYAIYSFILSCIRKSNSELSEKIHSNKMARAFLFSNIIPSKKYSIFYFTTPYKEVFSSFYSGLKDGHFRINDGATTIDFLVVNTTLETFDLKLQKHFNFLSPFVIRSKEKTLNKIDIGAFEKGISNSIMRVSKKLNLELDDASVKISGNEDDFKKKLFVFKNSKGENVYIRAFSALSPSISISFNDEKAKAIALYYGIGDRTKLGFGMLGLKRELNEGLS